MGIYDNPTAVAVGGTANLPTDNELPVDMHHKMWDSYPALTPITTMLTKIGESSSHNFQIDWIEKKEVPDTVIISVTESSASTTINVVANGTTLLDETLLYNPRNDDIRIVNGTPTNNAVTVVIDQGGKTSTIWKAGDVVHVMAPAIDENDETIRSVSVADSRVYNLHQIVRMQYGITRLEDKMSTHFGGPGSKRQELKRQKYIEYRRKKEKLVMFGGRDSGGTAPATKRMMGGLNHYLRDGTLFKDFGGICTESGFRNYIGDYKDQNPDTTELYCYAAGSVLDIVSDFGAGKVRISPKSKTYGLDITTYVSRGIKVNLVPLPLLDAGTVTSGWGWLLDLDRIKLKTIDRDFFYPEAKNIGLGEIIYDLYRGVFTLMLANESRHSMFVGADS